ncbi:DUF6512 family protein [Candidatus Leptofilum sp.]|uniref:DUF6512 family protein n=1 Tax=Candidatus Leptofilum sp. TaxID=3241576 RepID=UPI003B5A2097
MSTLSTQPPRTLKEKAAVLFRSRRIMAWEIGGIFFINIVGGSLHFAFELSGFTRWVGFFASVNESTWEHLKFYFWAGLLYALIEYTYVKDDANNFPLAKAISFLVTPIVLCLFFYGYLAITLPLYGRGYFLADIACGVIGVIAGQIVSSYFLQREPLGAKAKQVGLGLIAALTIMFSTFTFYPPKFFLFEDFLGHEFTGQYGILEDYGPYMVFEFDTDLEEE